MIYMVQTTYRAREPETTYRRGGVAWLFACGLAAGDTIVWTFPDRVERTHILAVGL